VSKIGKIFNSPIFGSLASLSPLHRLFSKPKKKTVFINLAPKAKTPTTAAIPTSDTASAERRVRTAAKLKQGGTTGFAASINNEDEEDVIRRAASRKAKLLGG